MQQQTEPKAAETNAEATDGSGGVRQLLGLKGGVTKSSSGLGDVKSTGSAGAHALDDLNAATTGTLLSRFTPTGEDCRYR